MHQTNGLAEVVFRDWISHAPCIEIEVTPGRELLIVRPYTGKAFPIDKKKTLTPVQQNRQRECQFSGRILQGC